MLHFGASGDLAKRNFYPFPFRLYKSGNLSEHFVVIEQLSDLGVRNIWICSCFSESPSLIWQIVPSNMTIATYYQSFHDVNGYGTLHCYVNYKLSSHGKYQAEHTNSFLFLSTSVLGTIAKHPIKKHVDGKGFERLIVEKPFGTDYEIS